HQDSGNLCSRKLRHQALYELKGCESEFGVEVKVYPINCDSINRKLKVFRNLFGAGFGHLLAAIDEHDFSRFVCGFEDTYLLLEDVFDLIAFQSKPNELLECCVNRFGALFYLFTFCQGHTLPDDVAASGQGFEQPFFFQLEICLTYGVERNTNLLGQAAGRWQYIAYSVLPTRDQITKLGNELVLYGLR